jgi:hypothetical protein
MNDLNFRRTSDFRKLAGKLIRKTETKQILWNARLVSAGEDMVQKKLRRLQQAASKP